MNDKLDYALNNVLERCVAVLSWRFLRPLGVLFSPIFCHLHRGFLLREAGRCERKAEEYRDDQPEVARDFRQLAAELRDTANQL